MSALLQPFKLKDVTLRNRIAVPPMCQYMAVDGYANDWHLSHYASMARGGAGLVIVEATAVSPEGRITPGCTGIWSDDLAQAFVPVVQAIKSAGVVPGIQIAHAGRKASANVPWEGDDHIAENDARGWQTIAPSAIAYGKGLPKQPEAMTLDDIARVRQDFVDAENFPLTIRFGVIEYDGRDEQTLLKSIGLVRDFKAAGMDMNSVSIGFTIPETSIPWAPGFLGSVAERVRREADVPVSSAWGFGTPEIAERVVKEEQLDVVMVGRSHLANPH